MQSTNPTTPALPPYSSSITIHYNQRASHTAPHRLAMPPPSSLLQLLTLFILLTTTLTLARQTPTSFCKCICFTNSTIIPLNASSISTSTPQLLPLPRRDDETSTQQQQQQHKRLTCADCTKAFCLDQDLAICKGAKEADVFTSCFRKFALIPYHVHQVVDIMMLICYRAG